MLSMDKTLMVMGVVVALVLGIVRAPVFAAETYEYDTAGRLLKVTYADGASIAYAYDNNGNLLAVVSSETLVVPIDIKPGNFPNSINLGSGGLVSVAILSTVSFDATTVDPTSVTLASASVALKGKGTPQAAVEDVNSDGREDLVVHVETSALTVSETDTEAILTGRTASGQTIRGSDSIRIVP